MRRVDKMKINVNMTNDKKDVMVQVLVSTMNRNTMDFLKKMHITSNVIVGNQNGTNDFYKLKLRNYLVEVYNSNEKGLSRNRNLTLQKATADICLLADDDIIYLKGYEDIIRRSFMENSDADILIFNLIENPVTRYVIRKKFRVNYFNYMRFGSVRIAFKRNSIINANINFDNRFGSGAEVPLGEDTIFLHDCLKAGLKIYAIPEYILSLTNDRESTWFKGYDESYFINKGKLYKRISKRMAKFLCIQDAYRHKMDYSKFGNWITVYKKMVIGVNSK